MKSHLSLIPVESTNFRLIYYQLHISNFTLIVSSNLYICLLWNTGIPCLHAYPTEICMYSQKHRWAKLTQEEIENPIWGFYLAQKQNII